MSCFVSVLLFISICFLFCDAEVYYISEDQPACIGNSVSPCYSLQQLSNGNELLSNKTSIITLFIELGTQIIPENYTLLLSNLTEVTISPRNQKSGLIKCHSGTNITFQNVKKLSLLSLNFSSCSLLFDNQALNLNSKIFINQCVFIESKENYAITIAGTSVGLKILFGNCKFLSNKGTIHYKAEYFVVKKTVTIIIINTTFSNNTGVNQIFHVDGANLFEVHGTSFKHNAGGAINIGWTNFAWITNTSFLSNHANLNGGAIKLYHSPSSLSDCLFQHNSAAHEGGAIFHDGSDLLTVEQTKFVNNSASFGGAIFANLAGITRCLFEGNYATHSSGGAIHFRSQNKASIVRYSLFQFNKAKFDGGAIYCVSTLSQSAMSRSSTMSLLLSGGNAEMNKAVNGGFLYLLGCAVSIQQTYNVALNEAQYGGAIFASNSRINIPGVQLMGNSAQLSLVSNTAVKGGAIYSVDSKIEINFYSIVSTAVTQVTFKNNSALQEGGAIYIRDYKCESIHNENEGCLIEVGKQGIKSMLFQNNSGSHGPVLYGGLLDRCYQDNASVAGIIDFKSNSEYEPTPLAITSDAVKVCFCLRDFTLNCTRRSMEFTKMSGEEIEVAVTPVDQDENQVPSVIRTHYEKVTASLGEGEGRNRVDSCTTLRYHVFTADTSAKLIMQPESVCERSLLSRLVLTIKITECSRGFEKKGDRCVCDRRLVEYLDITECFIVTRSTKRKDPIWLEYDDSLKMARNCPPEFCNNTSDSVSFLTPSDQCAGNRSGVLCGACRQNYSVVFGSSRCLPCAQKYAFIWLIFVFALAGVGLVSLLLILNLTISHGTLNGLIFYANVISIGGLTNIHNCSINPFLSVFIAWINLDLGIETCFYPGMNTYQKAWLQYAFPLYIIVIVVFIIVASYYSSTVMKIFGTNNIAILATLFLLSYTKALKTVSSAFGATQVFDSDADNVSAPVLSYQVWSLDGNIEYLKGKHVALFTVALLFLALCFLPYTLLLTFGQFLRSNPLKLRCLSKLTHSTAFVSILDAYHAPYNRRHRYWTGLMLITRCVLFVIFAASSSGNPVVSNAYATALVILGILLIKTCHIRVYRSFWNDLLELSFHLNLEVLSLTISYLKGIGANNSSVLCKCMTTSISASFITFLGIMTYHAYLQILKTKLYRYLKGRVAPILKVLPPTKKHQPPNSLHTPTTTHLELREELLASS